MICKHCGELIEGWPSANAVNIKFKYRHISNGSMYCDGFGGEGVVRWAEPFEDKTLRELRDLENDWPYGNRSALRELLAEAYQLGNNEARDKAINAIIDMAERYDTDIEGCDADELTAYTEAISCCFRLAYIVKYGKFPRIDRNDTSEFVPLLKQIREEKDVPSNPPAPIS